MLNKVIPYSFYSLFFLTPLFWSSLNYELFEFNKMILVYGFTVIIVGTWILKTINDKRLTINRTPLDIPLLLFLGANILSTIFSIDPHTSIWGYYSRSNGGLLSLISYLLLYWAFVSNMDFDKVKTTLKFGLASGFLISLWAILEHFGVSPSCVILRGEFNASCWIQDVQARVFATLGQPNWLAAYLAMLIFPCIYFVLTASSKLYSILYTLYSILLYLAFTFTYSRGPTLGLIGGMGVFIIGYIFCHPEGKARRISELVSDPRIRERFTPRVLATSWWRFASLRMTEMGVVLATFLIINLLFGSALTSFRLVSKFAAPVRPGIALPVPSVGTQLENGGTESGQIRFIVWRGALDIFKNNPIFGSGLETFAYSYYQYRPAQHNLTSEWDFLYNKAHNEYLNYLATTGIVGFMTYMLVISTFVYWSIKITYPVILSVAKNLKIRSRDPSSLESRLDFLPPQDDKIILVLALLAAYVSYIIYNFFLFSVVIIAVFFYLFPALAFVATGPTKNLTLPKQLFPFQFSIFNLIYRRPLYTRAVKGFVILSILYLLFSIFRLWYADTLFAKGQRASETGNPGRAYNLLAAASDLNKSEPFYRSELGFAAAQAAISLKEIDATLSADLKNESTKKTEAVLKQSPNNVSFLRTAIRTYFALSVIDQKFIAKTLAALDTAIRLAPTDPKLYYNQALVLDNEDKKDEEIEALKKTIQLKPNYPEALIMLKEATASAK